MSATPVGGAHRYETTTVIITAHRNTDADEIETAIDHVATVVAEHP